MGKGKEVSNKQKRYNKIDLKSLNNAARSKSEVEISNVEDDVQQADKIICIKRDGRREPYKPNKMRKVALYGTAGDEAKADELLRDTEIKLHNEIHVKDMFKQLVTTAVNKISLLYPDWEDVAARLSLLEMYKDSWNIKRNEYPHISVVLDKGIQHKIYDKETFKRYTDLEIEEINSYIVQDRDFLFNYKGVITFWDKYCMNYSKTKKLELPQHVYMRVAMALNVNEKHRVHRVKELYDVISKHEATLATPIMLNAGTPEQQLSSCVLNQLDDDTNSILDSNKNLGIYSKFKGGTALDISKLRAKGSYIIGNQGYSSGPVPFIKIVEATMKAFNQGGKRPGSCVVTYPWWHIDFNDLIVLKSNGGTDENRARGLKYSVKLNEILFDRYIKDEDLTFFDPKEAESLQGVVGDEFNEAYLELEKKASVKKKTMNAREFFFKVMKERTETGNIYLFHEENVNFQGMLNRYINSSNLCQEITLPSRPSKLVNEELFTMEDGKRRIVKRYEAGEIALCNLSSYNLEKYNFMTDEERQVLANIMVRAIDNTVELAVYPVKEGKNSNKQYRYEGIGVLNYANYLALNKLKFDSQEALEETDELFDDLSYYTISASCELAKEKGRFEKFYETAWADGEIPHDRRHPNVDSLTKYRPDMQRWDGLRDEIITFGLRNATLMAIAPTATSGKAINAVESIEPIQDFFYKEEGTINIPTVVPNFRKNNQYYVKAFDCDQMMLVRAAAVRQKWLDQAQSVNMYVKYPDSLEELMDIHIEGFSYGVKTFYYLKQIKNGAEEICESCT
jgi:ribonucleoside-diphosphate reductase alpha chain